MKKIIGIFVSSLLILTIIFPISLAYQKNQIIMYENILSSKTNNDLPYYFSWKDHEGYDWTTPAKNQGSCGSCWVFAAIGAIESCIKISENDPNIYV